MPATGTAKLVKRSITGFDDFGLTVTRDDWTNLSRPLSQAAYFLHLFHLLYYRLGNSTTSCNIIIA